MARSLIGLSCVTALMALVSSIPAQKRVTRQDLRRMVLEVGLEHRAERLRHIYETYARPFRERLRKARYRPGQSGENTRVFPFKQTPTRELKIYLDFPPDWQSGDGRSAIVFWYGGGFTQGGASQFFPQSEYFTRRGMVVARPEYRVADIDDTMPHHAIEDGISAMRWLALRAGEFGVDPDRIAVGGGSAGGCMASVIGTLDQKAFARLGFIGPGEDPNHHVRPAAMLLYNPFVDFFDPNNERHHIEEAILMGIDPEEIHDLYHLISAIDHLKPGSPPNIILFGTRDAFYPQQLRWIVKCRSLGIPVHDYVYKNEVHSWFNHSPHLEYTTAHVDRFLQEVGLLASTPEVALPRKPIPPDRARVHADRYRNKPDWDEKDFYRRFAERNSIRIIPYQENRSR